MLHCLLWSGSENRVPKISCLIIAFPLVEGHPLGGQWAPKFRDTQISDRWVIYSTTFPLYTIRSPLDLQYPPLHAHCIPILHHCSWFIPPTVHVSVICKSKIIIMICQHVPTISHWMFYLSMIPPSSQKTAGWLTRATSVPSTKVTWPGDDLGMVYELSFYNELG